MPKTSTPEPKFQPGDICKCEASRLGIVTRVIVSQVPKDDKTIFLYRGIALNPDEIGQRWESKNPTLLHRLGDDYDVK